MTSILILGINFSDFLGYIRYQDSQKIINFLYISKTYLLFWCDIKFPIVIVIDSGTICALFKNMKINDDLYVIDTIMCCVFTRTAHALPAY